eukprot:7448763-Prorocentrum_lima.AAC.1
MTSSLVGSEMCIRDSKQQYAAGRLPGTAIPLLKMRQRAREAAKGKRSWLMIVLDVSAAFDEVRRERIDE